MIKVQKFTFGPFAENSYVLFDETNECVIIDPGCSNAQEEELIVSFISENNLKPVRLLNTHCHVDHVFGNQFIANKYNLELEAHELDLPTLNMVEMSVKMYGIPGYKKSPEIVKFLNHNDIITFGNSELKVLFTPGHAPGHVVFYNEPQHFVINGDVLFHLSVGRMDLPGGSEVVLRETIKNVMYALPDETVVFCGHGEETTIGFEKRNNPFIRI